MPLSYGADWETEAFEHLHQVGDISALKNNFLVIEPKGLILDKKLELNGDRVIKFRAFTGRFLEFCVKNFNVVI